MEEKINVPRVSIIVPVYNVEEYLPRCLNSILAQTILEWECICVNDGSPDSCGAILDEYAAKDSRFVVIHQQNGGTASARNAGLKAARGEYIGFVDPDDWIEADAYKTAVEAAESSSADIVQWNFVKDFSHKSYTPAPAPEGYYSADDPKYFSRDVWNKLFRRSLITESGATFPVGIRMGQDTAFLYMICVFAKKCFYIETPLYHNCYRESSVTGKPSADKLDDRIKAVEIAEAFFKASRLKEEEYCWALTRLKMLAKRHALIYLPKPDVRLCRSLFPEVNAGLFRFFLKERSEKSLLLLLAAWRLDPLVRLAVFLRRSMQKRMRNANITSPA